MDIASLIQDKKAQSEGAWIEYQEGTEFLLRSRQDSTFQEKALKAFEPPRGHKPYSVKEQADIANKTMAIHAVLGWKGINIGGEEFEYSEKNALFLMENVPEIAEFISDEIQNNENFTKERIEALGAATKRKIKVGS